MKILETEVSFYKNYWDRRPELIRLKTWLYEMRSLDNLVQEIRKASPERRKRLKKQLPAITPSGVFEGRGAAQVIRHSGLICLDFDNIIDIGQTKDILSKLPYIAYVGLSASGMGLYALARISEPTQHKYHFEALKEEMVGYGLAVDPVCSNPAHLRFYSFDKHPIIKEATPYKKQIFCQSRRPEFFNSSPLFETLLARVRENNTDITKTYADWLAVGSVLACSFGEHGRFKYHEFSRYHPEYCPERCDKQYDKCLGNILSSRPFGIGLLLNVAKKHGVFFRESR